VTLQPPEPVLRVVAGSGAEVLCARLRALVAERGGGLEVVCDVSGLTPDARAVDALARLALAARRLGCRIALRGASAELVRLIAFCGLRGVPSLGVEAQRQAEEREHPLGVEERVDRRDAPV
jgi:hypothetical protein